MTEHRSEGGAQPTRVAFVGLGVMGYSMAGHWARAGFDVAVYNRTRERARSWANTYSGHQRPSPAEAAEGASLVALCVGRDDDVRAVVLGDHGVLSRMTAGSILVDHTTASARLARELDTTCRELGIGFLDAPVSGGQAGAENGQLTIMCGGDADVFARARPILEAYAKALTHMGPAGSGQLTKMVNQICATGLLQGLSEGIHFAQRAGLDVERVLQAISKGAAQSWQMDNRAHTMAEGKFDYGFAVEWMRKDLGIAIDEARSNGAALPVTALVDQFYAEVEAMGGKRWDTSSLIARLSNAAQQTSS